MTFEPGKKLGPYEIVAPVGAGGMGEVYRANDSRLERTVAIKVLPEHLAESEERRKRFEREAKAISQLNHPHICTLYDVGEQDGVDYLVMEYIEGETLADVLQKGALPIALALEYAVQIADALDKAHRAGIVHRDLKPANIITTKSGVKLLDFGLARLVSADEVSDASDAMTKQQDLTKDHTVVGTLHYMSPEQLEGKSIDTRADIFAFGVVLYEMVTGKRAFEGDSTASLITAIMSSEPRPVSELRTVAPTALDRIVKKCLVKDRDNRWQTALDLRDEIEWVRGGGDRIVSGPTAPTRSRNSLAFAAIALIAALATWALSSRESTVDDTIRHFTVPIPPGVVLPSGRGVLLTVADNGSRIAFMGERDGVAQLFVRAAAERDFVPIEGTEEARHPSLSPDGERIAFDLLGQPFTLDFGSGRVAPVADRGVYPTWSPDGSIYYWNEGIWRAPAGGGTSEELARLPLQQTTGNGRLKVLPNGNAVLFELAADDSFAVGLLPLDSAEIRTIVSNGANPRYSTSGHLIFTRGGDVLAAPFDAESLRITGDAVPLGRNIRVEAGAAGQFDITADGTLVYSERVASDGRLVHVDHDGNARPLIDNVGEFSLPSSTRDGDRIVVVERRDLWILDVARSVMSRLTFEGRSYGPVWSPDASEVVFTGGRLGLGGAGSINRIASVGTATPTTVTGVPLGSPIATSWFPQGGVVLMESLEANSWDIQLLSLDDGEHSAFLATPFNERDARFSPNGRFVAYESDESGRYEVFVVSYPDAERKLQISDNGGRYPRWSRSGDQVFYRKGDAMMSVAVDTSDELVAQKARVLFEAPFARQGPDYDVLGEEGFVMIQTETSKESIELHVIQNWFEELKQIVPSDN